MPPLTGSFFSGGITNLGQHPDTSATYDHTATYDGKQPGHSRHASALGPMAMARR